VIAAGLVLASPTTAGAAPGDGAMQAFDTCETPSVDAMAAWRGASPYQAIGIYIGGASRACPNPALTTPAWVNAVTAQGWKLLPIYVGPQAPCTRFLVRITDNAVADGAWAANDAADHALAAGLRPGAPIYADIEHYVGDAACDDVVRAFLRGWTTQLHARGFRSGLYGNTNSAIVAEAGAAWRGDVPVDGVWYAWWTGGAQFTGIPGLPDTSWDQHQRVHQYAGEHKETWGGVTIAVDSNLVDGLTTP
jgi:hypothetical protein